MIYKRAIQRCYEQILHDEIKWKKRRLTQSYRLSTNLKNAVNNNVNNEHFVQLQDVFENLIGYKATSWIATHNKKLESLRLENDRKTHRLNSSSIDPIKNYSHRKLTSKEHSALTNGLDFVYENSSFDEKDFISNVETFYVSLLGRCTDKYDWEEKESDENAVYNLTPEQLQYAAKLRSISNRFLKNVAHRFRKNNKDNKQQLSVLKELANDKSIHITPADKGNCVVILDRKDYVDKMLEILNDSSTFEKLDHDPTIKKGKQIDKYASEDDTSRFSNSK